MRHKRFQQRATTFKAVLLVFVLASSLSVVTMLDPFGENSGSFTRNGARSSIIASGPTLEASSYNASVNDSITFHANASSDDPSATLIFTIFYDYYQSLYPLILNPSSPVTVSTTGSPGSVATSLAYDHPGNLTLAGRPYFWVIVFVDDGMENVSASIQVYVSLPQTAPYFLPKPDPFVANAGTTQNILIRVVDNQSDVVTVFWDFGDGTNATNVTAASPEPGVQLMQSHAWNPMIPGKGDYNKTYFLNLSLSDGFHPPVNSSTPITIVVPTNKPPSILDPGVTASRSLAIPMDQINFTAATSDPEGDNLTWTYNYADGFAEVYRTPRAAPNMLVWKNATHSFALPGNYTVYLSVSDALVPNQIGSHNVTVSTVVQIRLNVPPTAKSLNVEPSSPVINSTLGYVNVTLSVEALDHDGDNFTLTWDFGVFGTRTNYSVGDAAQRMNDFTKYRQLITFTAIGSYNFYVTIADGLPGHEVRLTAVANVSSTNRAPSILDFEHAPYSLGDFAAANESVEFKVVITDRERDTIELIWDFGDGGAKHYMNRSDYDAKGNLTVYVNHTFALRGNYTLKLIVTDNKVGGAFNHTLNTSMPIKVSVRPPAVVQRWTWWDTTSLSMFVTIPILLVLWGFIGMYRRRRMEMIESFPVAESGSSIEGSLETPPKNGFEGGS